MKKAIILLIPVFILLLSGCRKCYTCTQYCIYCVPKGNTGIAKKACATNGASYARVDSFFNAWKASGDSCVRREDDRNVCDGENSIDEAVAYYQKQEYYCAPKVQ